MHHILGLGSALGGKQVRGSNSRQLFSVGCITTMSTSRAEKSVSLTHNTAKANGKESDSEEKPAGGNKKQVKHDSGAADLEKVTDYMEDSEISSQSIAQAVNQIGERRSKDEAQRVARQKELDKVTIRKEDVELIMSELDISKLLAEQSLREHAGDVVEALKSLTD